MPDLDGVLKWEKHSLLLEALGLHGGTEVDPWVFLEISRRTSADAQGIVTSVTTIYGSVEWRPVPGCPVRQWFYDDGQVHTSFFSASHPTVRAEEVDLADMASVLGSWLRAALLFSDERQRCAAAGLARWSDAWLI